MRIGTWLNIWLNCIAFALLLSAREVSADPFEFQSQFMDQALLDSAPTGVPPGELSEKDFEWVTESNELKPLQIRWVPKSVEWVRVGELVLIPRARVRFTLDLQNIQTAVVRFNHRVQPFALVQVKGKKFLEAEIPIVLLSGTQNTVEVTWSEGATQNIRKLYLKQTRGSYFFVDQSCVNFAVQPEKIEGISWAYVGCRLVRSRVRDKTIANVEVFMIWDGENETLLVDSQPHPAQAPYLYRLSLRSANSRVRLSTRSKNVEFKLFVPERLYLVNLGLGLGPYLYHFNSPTDSQNTYAPLLTLYASYFLSDTVRFVAFNATAIQKKWFTDLGFYLNSESIRTMDRRLSVNLMLGGHIIWFPSVTGATVKPGLPQGFEIIYRDFLAQAKNLSAGSFVYPTIDGKAYYNMWLRWGGRGYFGEINYISWKESINSDVYSSRSLGLTFGFPIAQFF